MKNDNRFNDVETIEELLYQVAGAASMCWEHVDKAGIFDSFEAKAIAEEAHEKLIDLFGNL